jgi:hypothetical protein
MHSSTFTWYPERKEVISWEVSEVMHDLEKRPHLLLRLELTGIHFAARALPAFVRVGKVQSRFVRFDADGLKVLAYFDQPLPDRGTIRFGYGPQVAIELHDPYVHHVPKPLDRKRLHEGTLLYDARTAPG